jgi:hypothetical protein
LDSEICKSGYAFSGPSYSAPIQRVNNQGTKERGIEPLVILPLACIWFGDAMGGCTGPSGTIWITASSPGVIVCIVGWLLLIMPLFLILL